MSGPAGRASIKAAGKILFFTQWDSDLHLAARYIQARTRTLRLLSLLSKLWARRVASARL
jgi:hypothetical protein